MYLLHQVYSKLDGLGEPVCHYRQVKGVCTGICMEWLRRVMVKDKTSLSSTLKTNFHVQLWDEQKKKLGKKEKRWEQTQNAIYDSSRAAFYAELNRPTSTVNLATRKQLETLGDVEQDLEDAKCRQNISGGISVSTTVLQYALNNGVTPVSNKLLPKQIETVTKRMEAERSVLLDGAYKEWKEQCPIEMGVFKEHSKDLENVSYDEKGMALRARFSGLKVVDGVNKLTTNTNRAYQAMKQAMSNSLFTLKRGLMVGVFDAKGGHSHAVYFHQEGPRRYLWLDPNYGVWSMSWANVIRAMIFLYDHTDVKGEKGIYQLSGTLIPTGFEYSIWEKA